MRSGWDALLSRTKHFMSLSRGIPGRYEYKYGNRNLFFYLRFRDYWASSCYIYKVTKRSLVIVGTANHRSPSLANSGNLGCSRRTSL